MFQTMLIIVWAVALLVWVVLNLLTIHQIRGIINLRRLAKPLYVTQAVFGFILLIVALAMILNSNFDAPSTTNLGGFYP